MEGIAFSPSNNFNCYPQIHPIKTLIPIPFRFCNYKTNNPNQSLLSFSINSSKTTQTPITQPPPLVVVGSANADIYVEIDRLPTEGETISAKNGQTLAGGKGANQATCGAKLSYPTYFVGQVGDDAHGKLITQALGNGGVRLEYLKSLGGGVPTGHAVVMLQSNGQNSIIIVGGANMSSWPDKLSDQDLDVVKNAGIVLLQREIPDSVNIQVAKIRVGYSQFKVEEIVDNIVTATLAAKGAGVTVIMDAGGMDAPMPQELLKFVDIFSPNESELRRLTGMPTDNFEQISQAAAKCHKMGVRQVLVKLGAKGSALFIEGEEPITQPIIPAAQVVDTTGAGDTFTASFAVALVEGKSKRECLNFAAAAASLCVQVKGAIPSMPDRKSILNLLQSV
ncbi:hypothetical protein Gorai_015675 [Gossypium raimondii]|uniref:Ribokinase n=1 Tax=Gossypium raimondii TaxID=29730 RepID=A0A7J8P785_GOSRA|nr:hypothetical protein [Gossypium raimondii]